VRGAYDGAKGVGLARDMNDVIGQAVAAHPDRLAAFAHLPMRSPQAAAPRKPFRVISFTPLALKAYPANSGFSICSGRDAPDRPALFRGLSRLMMSQ
jgi:predicted TIM-barrel fold metal-dependent hydrolase